MWTRERKGKREREKEEEERERVLLMIRDVVLQQEWITFQTDPFLSDI